MHLVLEHTTGPYIGLQQIIGWLPPNAIPSALGPFKVFDRVIDQALLMHVGPTMALYQEVAPHTPPAPGLGRRMRDLLRP